MRSNLIANINMIPEDNLKHSKLIVYNNVALKLFYLTSRSGA